MMPTEIHVWVPLLAIYLVFLWWYGGHGVPLSRAEIDAALDDLKTQAKGEAAEHLLSELEQLLANDDGKEFIMQNLVRYRAQAMYPPGYDFDPDPRAADRRYGRLILPHLLRYGNFPIFIARRIGRFVEPSGVDIWHYVAMVRYRSRRDFLRFARSIARDDIDVHKWAAIERTQIFPVRPLISLFAVRSMVAGILGIIGFALT